MKLTATYSPCQTLRFTLGREWGNAGRVCYIGHNPSTAGHDKDDPTSLAWIHFARRAGFGGYLAVNLYPFRSSDPKACREWANWEQNGPDWWARDSIQQNVAIVAREAKQAAIVVACWGALAHDDFLVEHIVEEIQSGIEPYPDIYCVGTTLSGAPKHPLARGKHRVPRDQKFIPWRKAVCGQSV